MTQKITGKEIREFREKLGVSQSTFAHLLGFSNYGYLSALENGKVKPSKTTTIIFNMLRENRNKSI